MPGWQLTAHKAAGPIGYLRSIRAEMRIRVNRPCTPLSCRQGWTGKAQGRESYNSATVLSIQCEQRVTELSRTRTHTGRLTPLSLLRRVIRRASAASDLETLRPHNV